MDISAEEYDLINIPFALQVTAALAARTHPSHVLSVHSWDSIDCRLAVTRNSLGIKRTN